MSKEVALRGFGSGGGGLSMELLWENASPASTFANQTVPLDTSKFTAVLIEFRSGASNAVRIPSVMAFSKGSRYIALGDNNAGTIITRAFAVNDADIAFSAGYKYSTYKTYTEDNTVVIPVAIYGIK